MSADIYLRQGLIPQSDVELYPSEAVVSGAITGTLGATEATDSAQLSGSVVSAVVVVFPNAGVPAGRPLHPVEQPEPVLQPITGTLQATEAPDRAIFYGEVRRNRAAVEAELWLMAA